MREELVLRMYPGASKGRVAKAEYEALSTLRTEGYPVPQVYLYEQDPSKLGSPFIIMDLIRGQSMGPMPVAENDKLTKYGEMFSKLFADLHGLDWTAFTENPNPLPQNPTYFARSYLSFFDSRVTKLGTNILSPIIDWLKERINQAACKTPSVIHGDFHPFNILVTDNGDPFVIDWTACKVSDPRFDLGWTFMLGSTFDNPWPLELIIERYEKYTGQKVENIEFFKVLALLRRIDDFNQIVGDLGETGMRPDIIEIMKQNIEHFKNVHNLLENLTGIRIQKIDELLESIL